MQTLMVTSVPQFTFFRGLHQSSPLSPILFLLIAQIFSSKLDGRQKISGLSVHGVDVLLSLFADDTDIFIQANMQCVLCL